MEAERLENIDEYVTQELRKWIKWVKTSVGSVGKRRKPGENAHQRENQQRTTD